MYKAVYVNQAADRTRAVFDGNFAVFDGTTVSERECARMNPPDPPVQTEGFTF